MAVVWQVASMLVPNNFSDPGEVGHGARQRDVIAFIFYSVRVTCDGNTYGKENQTESRIAKEFKKSPLFTQNFSVVTGRIDSIKLGV